MTCRSLQHFTPSDTTGNQRILICFSYRYEKQFVWINEVVLCLLINIRPWWNKDLGRSKATLPPSLCLQEYGDVLIARKPRQCFGLKNKGEVRGEKPKGFSFLSQFYRNIFIILFPTFLNKGLLPALFQSLLKLQAFTPPPNII